ncbi:hypothetical protein HGB07_10300 [Candidatus Roizmanbacteria bacterium]|nr:hypothetical protein [Candidatus Roizmanbacteria bacterium]
MKKGDEKEIFNRLKERVAQQPKPEDPVSLRNVIFCSFIAPGLDLFKLELHPLPVGSKHQMTAIIEEDCVKFIKGDDIFSFFKGYSQ